MMIRTTSKPTGACANHKCVKGTGCRATLDGGYVCVCLHNHLVVKEPGKLCPSNDERTSSTATTTTHVYGSTTLLPPLGTTSFYSPTKRPQEQQPDHDLVVTTTSASEPAEQNQQQTMFIVTAIIVPVIVLTIIIGSVGGGGGGVVKWFRKRNQIRVRSRRIAAGRGESSVAIIEMSGPTTPRYHHQQQQGHCNPPMMTTMLHYSAADDQPQQQQPQAEEERPFLNAIASDRIKLGQVIGSGNFGKVFRALLFEDDDAAAAGGADDGHHHQGGKAVAVKTLKIDPFIANLEQLKTAAVEGMMQEARLMSTLNHPNIVNFYGVVHFDDGPGIVMEMMTRNLLDVLRSNNALMAADYLLVYVIKDKYSDALLFAEQISSGMRYLAEQHLVHRDLAARNCLFSITNGRPVVKVADFGLTRNVRSSNDYYKTMGQRRLPVCWMAPESLRGRFTTKSDVWSFGVTLWEMLTLGQPPYGSFSSEEVMELIREGHLLRPPPDTPQYIVDLLIWCWKSQEDDRITFAQINERLKLAIRRTASASPSTAAAAAVLLPTAHIEQPQTVRLHYAEINTTNSPAHAAAAPAVEPITTCS